MADISIKSVSGADAGTMSINWQDIAPRINKQLLHDAVVMYQANVRQGSNRTKTRAEVAGTTAKMYRQKGTGRARAGSIRSGVRRGGGHVHAKRPRDYSYRLPRKALRAATRMALAAQVRDEQVAIVDELSLSEPKTSTVAAMLSALGLAENTVLLVTAENDLNVYKSARNISGVECVSQENLNALSLLKPQVILFTKAAIEAAIERLSGEGSDSEVESAAAES